MAKILLDYVFPITVIEPIPAASTAFLKQVVVLAKPKAGQESNVGELIQCNTMAEVTALTNNTNAQQLFNAGMSRVFVLLCDDLVIEDYMDQVKGEAWTVLISDDFTDSDLEEVIVPGIAATIKIQDIVYTAKALGTDGNSITVAYLDTNTGGAATASVVDDAISVSIEAGVTPASAIAAAIAASSPANALVAVTVDAGDEADVQGIQSLTNLAGGVDASTTQGSLAVGTFDGVVGYSSSDAEVAQTFATPPNRVGFFRSVSNGAKNMFFAFGKLLSNQSTWLNQQYIAMPFNDGVETLGLANSMFDDRVSFVLNDTEFGNRLAFFVAGGKAIVAPYIKKNLSIDLQSQTLTWLSANQPQYTIVNATLLESNLQQKVIQEKYIDTNMITDGIIEIKLIQDNFVANGDIDITEPKAFWRVLGNLQSTL